MSASATPHAANGATPRERFDRSHPCPICDGNPGAPRGRGERCAGWLSPDGAAAFCSRIESARPANGNASRHWLFGPCDCGTTHRPWSEAPAELRERRDQKANARTAKRSTDDPKPWNLPDADVASTHPYTDAAGAVLFEVVRTTQAARDRGTPKTLPRYCIGERWFCGAGSWTGRSEEIPLYRHGEALAELTQGGSCHLVEGERDADRVAEAGGVAVCNAWGAGCFRDSHARALTAALADGAPSAALVVVVDRDEAGTKHARDVRMKLAKAGAPMDRVSFVLPRQGKDAADHLDAGLGLGDLEPFALEGDASTSTEKSADLSLEAVGFSGARLLALLGRPKPPPIEAARPLPGHFATLVAPPMVGKSTLAMWNAMARAAGVAPWPGVDARPAGRVLIYSLDEAPEQVARRMNGLSLMHPAGYFEKYAANLVVIGPDRDLDPAALDTLRFDDTGLATLTRWLEEAEAAGAPFAEVYVDAYADVIPLGETENSNEEATRIGGALERLAVHFGCAIVLLHHTGKPKADAGAEPQDVRWMGRGASALAAKARSVTSLELVSGMPHLRRVRTATNLGPAPRPALFAVCGEETAAEELLFFRPAEDPEDRDPRDYLAPGIAITTNDLARLLAGDALEDGKTVPGEMKRLASALRERWREQGKVLVRDGPNRSKMVELVDTEGGQS